MTSPEMRKRKANHSSASIHQLGINMSDKVVEKKVEAAPKVNKTTKGKKLVSRRFVIDCTKPANEGIIGMENFVCLFSPSLAKKILWEQFL